MTSESNDSKNEETKSRISDNLRNKKSIDETFKLFNSSGRHNFGLSGIKH